TLARKYEVTEYLAIIGHASNDVYSAAAEALPRGRAGVLQLNEHFRSNPQIIGFSNRHIYQQRLVLKTDPSKGGQLPIGAGVHRVNVSGQASRGERGRSWKNVLEAEQVMELVRSLRADGSMSHLSLGIVTPFAAQKDFLREMLAKEGLAGEILADSAYGFQGDERDIIIFSAVVGSGITPSASRWVESPPNLVNVALTRARQALFVVADFDYCMQQDSAGILRKLAEYCRDIQLLRDTSPAELELFSWMTVEGWTPKIHPVIGDIEVDFELRDEQGARLVIEVDGKPHHKGTKRADEGRDAFLRAQGCRIYRTPARAVLETPYAVIQEIQQQLSE
ncbi:MAG: AAA domain-containing protein, partial [Gammaproteobacteria bacterium]|nr:AAA domain-containing protein [Gammaproteobacteria bacterium]